MQPNLSDDKYIEIKKKISFLVGNESVLENMANVAPLKPFSDNVIEFLNALSKKLIKTPEAKGYPDVVTLGFWLRKSSITSLKERFVVDDDNVKVGRGVAFHIAPSNVPVNYAYSLFTGLITGNANIVRIPSKDFPQVNIINRAISEVLSDYEDINPYICLVRYGREQDVNDMLSSIADVRIIWGGDATIEEIRKSPLGPRATEISFADRYSLAVINSDFYMSLEDKDRFADNFYNDTYLSDQNACTSPRIVIWMGDSIESAKNEFWNRLHTVVKEKYTFQSIMGINKLTSKYIVAASLDGISYEYSEDNYIVRVKVDCPLRSLMDYKDNSGYFYEYDCSDIMEIRELCNDTHCQTIGFLGDKEEAIRLVSSGIRGVDRVVPIGSTMDFDLIWDGYNLVERFTRNIVIK